MGFTVVGTVNPNARLRGHLEHIWQLDDKVIITDLELAQPVMEWDGETFQEVAFTNEIPEPFGAFRAKYCVVSNERAIFANVESNGTRTEHLIVGSKRGDYQNVSVSQRPSSALSAEDPFFLIQPDYRNINGLVEFAGRITTSSNFGSIFNISGGSAEDFQVDELHPRSGAQGDEPMAYIGNDVLYGRQGRIESLKSTDKFGDVEADDLSVGISDLVGGFTNWSITYNARLQRAYCIPDNESQMWVLHKPLLSAGISPWSKWTTTHALGFNPTTIMTVIDPQDGLEYVLMGDASGNIYRMEGSGSSGDGGTESITAFRVSKLFSLPEDQEYMGLDGWISYRKSEAYTVDVTLEHSGYSVVDEDLTVDVTAEDGGVFYGGDYYYGGDIYYGVALSGRLHKQKIGAAGGSSDFQIRLSVTSTGDFAIHDFGFKLSGA